MSRGCARNLKKECGGLVVGPVVFIVEIRFGSALSQFKVEFILLRVGYGVAVP